MWIRPGRGTTSWSGRSHWPIAVAARFLPGTWHGVPPEHLAPALTEFFTSQ
jgi:hypothetical protein